MDFAFSLRELGVRHVPMNFLHPHPQTPLAAQPLLEPEGGMLGRGTASLPKGAVPVPPVPVSPYSIYFST